MLTVIYNFAKSIFEGSARLAQLELENRTLKREKAAEMKRADEAEGHLRTARAEIERLQVSADAARISRGATALDTSALRRGIV